ncbi:small-conductance mechanosensitive channel [Alkalihalobacillus deserti]|uniref:small-conductance mechanosensitive channel n=1 Tax=Alkalihalobacillus deserti TaxID=2879466 RepID=UPI001D144FF1|nr:small-conductance mechanosensitive channel [Alkalihalobacillus deserti]
MNNAKRELPVDSEKNNYLYKDDYIPFIVKWGRITCFLGLILSFAPLFVLTFIYGLIPDASSILTGFIAIAGVAAVLWIIEPISYYPILGIPGTYMSFLSGNIANLRLPCATAAQKAADVEPGTEKGAIISTLGIAVSIIVNVLILTLGVLLGSSLLASLPDGVKEMFNYILPALFGAIFGQFAISQPKIGIFAITVALIMAWLMKSGHLSFLPGHPSYAVIITSIFGTIMFGKFLYNKGIIGK